MIELANSASLETMNKRHLPMVSYIYVLHRIF